MTDTHRLTTLDSGVRIVTEPMGSVRSAALGVFIATGSAIEDERQAGLSHLIEHMLFRGTARYGSLEIDQLFDAMGAELNAGTGRESTSVYTRVLDVHLERAWDVIADMVWRPRFAPEDLDYEREIVLEELAMYEDDPQDKVFDVLGEAVFGSHPLGRAILGRREVVAGTPADDLRGFWAERYVPGSIVVAAAGSVDHERLVALVEAATTEVSGGATAPRTPPVGALQPAVRFHAKETEQVHVCLGAPGLPRDDPRRYALRVLDTILGGTSSSRLFQEVREKRGLAYSVYTFTSLHAHAGQVGLYLGTRPENLEVAMDVVRTELARIRTDPAAADELTRAKDNAKGSLVLSLESTTARMNRVGASVLAGLPVLSMDEIIAKIDAVTLDDVAALAEELLAPERLSAAGVGPDEDAFRAAVGPALAVAA